MQAHLRALDGVEAVTGLSLLQVACDDDGLYTLADTARLGAAGERAAPEAQDGGASLRPHRPWSLLLPMPEHLLALADATPDAAPQSSGIRDLAVGATLIVGGGKS